MKFTNSQDPKNIAKTILRIQKFLAMIFVKIPILYAKKIPSLQGLDIFHPIGLKWKTSTRIAVFFERGDIWDTS